MSVSHISMCARMHTWTIMSSQIRKALSGYIFNQSWICQDTTPSVLAKNLHCQHLSNFLGICFSCSSQTLQSSHPNNRNFPSLALSVLNYVYNFPIHIFMASDDYYPNYLFLVLGLPVYLSILETGLEISPLSATSLLPPGYPSLCQIVFIPPILNTCLQCLPFQR